MKRKIAVVIINDMNYEDTIECVKCALSQTYSDYHIVIVENGSSNKSYEVLNFIYGSSPKVTIIRSKRNLGYAGENNLGIRFAREILNADYVFVCNNDILFGDDLLQTIAKVDFCGIGVISPTVYRKDGKLQRPAIATDNIYIKALSTVTGIALTWILTVPPVHTLHEELNRFWKIKNGKDVPYEIKKHMLQSCSFFLTPEFFHYYNQLYPKTSLYWEEINLLMYLEKVKLTAMIADTSPVIHKDKGASLCLPGSQALDMNRLIYSTASMMKSLPMFFMNYSIIRKKYN
ncbi:MAG TPA: glycosyltransferase family 2 protein [Mobilitalea sp.]|nr:glycosyltransferase family 2 protein [Mobilitalea sp.]